MAKTKMAEFTILNVKGFLAELNLLKSVVAAKSTIPILTHIKIETNSDDTITLSGTDLDNTLICRFPAITDLSGAFCINLVTLIEAVKKAKSEVFFRVYQETYELNAGTKDAPKIENRQSIEIALTVDGASFTIEGVDSEQYPNLPLLPDLTETFLGDIGGGTLQELIKKSVFCATKEQSRFTLSALAMEFGKTGLRIIGTDGHRAGYAETLDFKESKLIQHHLLNLDAAKCLQRIVDGKVFIATDENHLIFKTQFGNRKLIARKASGQFPNYRMVLPKDLVYSFDFHPKEVLPVIQSALAFADERTKSIYFQPYYNNFVVKAGSSEKAFTGKATCDFPQNSAPGLACNALYLIDGCNLITDGTLKFEYKSNESQFQISGETSLARFVYVIMPLRLGEKGECQKNYQVLTDEEKPNYKLVPFYRNFTAEKVKESKPAKSQIISDISELLADLKTIAAIKGMPEMFTETVEQIVEEAKAKLNLL